ncbi:MAG: hypothetical protein KY442_10155 [Proteobacteria bacterium]|nr:hypothetical protein [Pseudomonadota bacterium]
MTAALAIGAAFAGSALAGEGEHDPPPPPPPPPPEEMLLCHNIGGPRDLGANCEATGNCTFILQDGSRIVLTGNQFLGIVIGVKSEKAIAAHLAHGDGWAIGPIYDPPLHLASVVGPHQASNVECFAEREFPQPPEPGN